MLTLSVGTRASVDQTLYRMVNAHEIVRIARGLYGVAGDIDLNSIALAVQKKTGERIGSLVPNLPSSKIAVVPTSGQSRTVISGDHHVEFRRMSPRKIKLSQTEKGRILLDLWNRGEKNLNKNQIKNATAGWLQEEIDRYASIIPEWLRVAISHSNEERKSIKIGLSGAYDWSSTQITDQALITKVLEKHKFEDVVRLCYYYGVAKVKRVFQQHQLDPMTTASVARMLKNISKGFNSLSIVKGKGYAKA